MLMDLVYDMGWENVNLARTGGHSSSGNSNGGSDGSNGGSTVGGNETGKKKSSTRKYICPQCSCSVRATKAVNIGCLGCGRAVA